MRMAQMGLQFTPCVALAHDGQAVLMEVQASLRLWGGPALLRHRIEALWQSFGWQSPDTVRIAMAPTARGALWIALSDPIPSANTFVATLQRLPLGDIAELQPHQSMLERMGIRTIGQLDGLPRGGITRRFGRACLQALDAAFGRAPDPYAWITAPPAFQWRRELPARAEHTTMIEEALRRGFQELAAWLHARQCGLQRLDIVLHHDAPPPTALTLGFSNATRDARRFGDVLHERLTRLVLPHPVYDVELRAHDVVVHPHETPDFLGTPAHTPTALLALMERLQARLGPGQVQRLHHTNDHRPERACTLIAADLAALRSTRHLRVADSALLPDSPHRPVWLLARPTRLPLHHHRPTYHGPLQLLSGPERIETGWWEDHLDDHAQRDYFIARSRHDELLWIFRTPAHDWYMHGFFS